MKTASVRDLRNRFADVAKMIEHGQEVTITRNGAPFAILSAAKAPAAARVDWAARFKAFPPVGKEMSRAATEKLWSALRD